MVAWNSGSHSAAERNKGPIFQALYPWLQKAHHVLEIGSGQGTHARHACHLLEHLYWQPSETASGLAVLSACLENSAEPGLLAPLELDVDGRWPSQLYDMIYAANVAHIMSRDEVAKMFTGIGERLLPDGVFGLYGPFWVQDEPASAGNMAFDHALRMKDPDMGLRHLETLDQWANEAGLGMMQVLAMPSNNKLIIWEKASGTRT